MKLVKVNTTVSYKLNEKSTLVQVMAWCRQAKGEYTWASVDPDLCRHVASQWVKKYKDYINLCR